LNVDDDEPREVGSHMVRHAKAFEKKKKKEP
jgi:hypothetical protein